MIQKRAGWLTALFLGEMLTATAMGVFEAGDLQGGGAGAVRAADHLERRQLRLAGVDAGHPRAGARRSRRSRDWWRVMRREMLAGLALGVILGTIGFLRITLWSAFSDIYGAALAAGRDHRGDVAGRRRAVGHADRLAAAVPAAPARLRSRRPRRRRSWRRSWTSPGW